MDRTGMAKGTLSPIIYFEHADGRVILAPNEIGHGDEHSRMAYKLKYGNEGWEWREARTLTEVDALQDRLIRQELRARESALIIHGDMRSRVRRETGEALRERMCSSETTAFERDFIKSYLQLREEKRDKYRASLEHYQAFFWAREMDSKSKIEDQLPLQEGQFER